MNELVGKAFETGMILGLSFGFIGFLVGLIMNLLSDYGRG